LSRSVDAARRLRDWMVGQALPLWADRGFDRAHGRFEERLTLQGHPGHDAPVRLTVQARQIYSYALARRRGWYGGDDQLLEGAYRAMLRDYHRPDGKPGWVFSVHRDGTPCEARRDLYAHAFVLLAIGSYVGTTGDRAPLALADETLSYLDTDFGAPAGGYVDSLPPIDELRRQNPHMHLFEALLNLWVNTRDPRYLDRAGKLFDLFSRRFFQPDPGVLIEYFDQALAPASGVAGKIVEPGHQCEWIWLLRWYQREAGVPVEDHVEALFSHADRYGRDRAGLLVDEVLADGSVRTPSRRLWPMTEAIRAYSVEGRLGRPGCADKAAVLVDLLHQHFLSGAVPGGWIDRLDEQGRATTDFMPASSLYHLLGAVDELDRTAA